MRAAVALSMDEKSTNANLWASGQLISTWNSVENTLCICPNPRTYPSGSFVSNFLVPLEQPLRLHRERPSSFRSFRKVDVHPAALWWPLQWCRMTNFQERASEMGAASGYEESFVRSLYASFGQPQGLLWLQGLRRLKADLRSSNLRVGKLDQVDREEDIDVPSLINSFRPSKGCSDRAIAEVLASTVAKSTYAYLETTVTSISSKVLNFVNKLTLGFPVSSLS